MLTRLESLANARALIVDDNPINRQVLFAQLQPLMPLPGLAGDASEALRMSRERVFDLLLLDLHLPDRSGSELLGDIRQDPANNSREALAVAITADPSLADPGALADAGFHGVLIKPVTPEQLFRCLKQIQTDSRFFAADPTQLRDSQVLDDHAGLKSADNDPELLLELRRRLATDLRESLPELEELIAGLRINPGRDLLHRLAGGAAYCGAGQLQRACLNLHAALQEPLEAKHLALAYLEFHSATQRLLNAVNQAQEPIAGRAGLNPSVSASI